MTTVSNISFLGQSTSQSSRLSELNNTLENLQRQATTLKKHDTFSGFGADAIGLQRFRSTYTMTQGYLDNIDKVSRRITVMSNVLTEITRIGSELVSGLSLQAGSSQGMTTVSAQAEQNLKFVEDLLNQQIDGRYLFGGSDVSNPPFADHNTLDSNFSSKTISWLAGGLTNAQLTTATDAFTSTNLGLSAGLATAGAVTARIDQNLDLDYSVKADEAGFKDIINALSFVANLRYPEPPGDVATPAQFRSLVTHITSIATRGVEEVGDLTRTLASKFSLISLLQEKHVSDNNLYAAQIDEIENTNTTEVIASIQALQTQLSSAYEVTTMVSRLSLINFL